MSKLLYLQASPRADRSYSRAAADAFASKYRETHPEDEVITVDLFKKELPAFDGLALQAKYTILHGKEHSEEELAAWKSVEEIIEEFKGADKYLFAVPMWNFGIPYRLKQYLDILLQPGYTFSYSEEDGYSGLISGKPAVTIYSRGGEYISPEGDAYDFQKRYLDLALGFIGITDVKPIFIQPTLMGGPEKAEEVKTAAIAEAEGLACNF